MVNTKKEEPDQKTPSRSQRKRPQNKKWNPVPKEDTSSEEEEDIEICPICDSKNDPNPKDNKNRMIGCDGCDKWFHWSCVGVNYDNKPEKHEDWFCKKCSVKKPEASEWKPDKTDEAILEVIPARESSRGTKSETKNSSRGRGRGKERGGSKSVGSTPKSNKKSGLSPVPEIILSPVTPKDKKDKKESRKVVVDLFGSKDASDDDPIILGSGPVKKSKQRQQATFERILPAGSNRSSPAPTNKSSPAPTSKSSPAPTSRSSPAPTNKSSPAPTNRSSPAPTSRTTPDPASRSSQVSGRKSSVTYSGSDSPVHIPPGLSLSTVTVKMQNINKITGILNTKDDSKNSVITIGEMTGDGSDSDDSDDLQNSTVSSSGPDGQDPVEKSEKGSVKETAQLEETTLKVEKKASNTGRVTPLKLNLKQLNSDKGKKRKHKSVEPVSKSKRHCPDPDLTEDKDQGKADLISSKVTSDKLTSMSDGLSADLCQDEEDDRMSVVPSVGDVPPSSPPPEETMAQLADELESMYPDDFQQVPPLQEKESESSNNDAVNDLAKMLDSSDEPAAVSDDVFKSSGNEFVNTDCPLLEQIPNTSADKVASDDSERKKIVEIRKELEELEELSKEKSAKAPEAPAAPNKKVYSWTIAAPVVEKRKSLEDHLYVKTDGGQSSAGQHSLPQTVEQPSSFSKLQALMQQGSSGQTAEPRSTSADKHGSGSLSSLTTSQVSNNTTSATSADTATSATIAATAAQVHRSATTASSVSNPSPPFSTTTPQESSRGVANSLSLDPTRRLHVDTEAQDPLHPSLPVSTSSLTSPPPGRLVGIPLVPPGIRLSGGSRTASTVVSPPAGQPGQQSNTLMADSQRPSTVGVQLNQEQLAVRQAAYGSQQLPSGIKITGGSRGLSAVPGGSLTQHQVVVQANEAAAGIRSGRKSAELTSPLDIGEGATGVGLQNSSQLRQPVQGNMSEGAGLKDSVSMRQHQIPGIRISKQGGSAVSAGLNPPVAGVNSLSALSSSNYTANTAAKSLLPAGLSISPGKTHNSNQTGAAAALAQPSPTSSVGGSLAGNSQLSSSVVLTLPVQNRQAGQLQASLGSDRSSGAPAAAGQSHVVLASPGGTRRLSGNSGNNSAAVLSTASSVSLPITNSSTNSSTSGYLYPLNSRLGPPVIPPPVTISVPVQVTSPPLSSQNSQPVTVSSSRSASVPGARIQVASGLQSTSTIQETTNIHSVSGLNGPQVSHQQAPHGSQVMAGSSSTANNLMSPSANIPASNSGSLQQVQYPRQNSGIANLPSPYQQPLMQQHQQQQLQQQQPQFQNQQQHMIQQMPQQQPRRGGARGAAVRVRGAPLRASGQHPVRVRGPRPQRGAGPRPAAPGMRGAAPGAVRPRMRGRGGGVRQVRPLPPPVGGQVRPPPAAGARRMSGPGANQTQQSNNHQPLQAQQGHLHHQAVLPVGGGQVMPPGQSHQGSRFGQQTVASMSGGHAPAAVSQEQQQIADHQARYYQQAAGTQQQVQRAEEPPVIKIEDEEDEIVEIPVEKSSPTIKKKTLEKLKQIGGLTIVRKEAPKIPRNLNLPPGISVSPAVDSPGGRSGRRSSGNNTGGAGSTQQVTLNLNEEQKRKLIELGIL